MNRYEGDNRRAFMIKQAVSLAYAMVWVVYIVSILTQNLPFPRFVFLFYWIGFAAIRIGISLVQNHLAKKKGTELPYPKLAQWF